MNAALSWRVPSTEVHAFAASRAILTCAYVVYVAAIAGSVLGLQPLGSRIAASLLLGAGVAAGFSCLGRLVPGERPRGGIDTARGDARETPAQPARVRSLALVGGATFASGCAATLAAFVLALLLPVGAYDALGYRLPVVVQWLDAGAVVWVTGDDPLRNGYPLALEVVSAVLFRALDSAAAVDAVASLFVLAGAASLFGLARASGARPAAVWLATGLFLLVPIHLLNAPSGYVDAAFAGALVTLFVAAARWALAPSTSGERTLDLGVALALVTALKPHGFAFALLSLSAALWQRRRTGRARVSFRELTGLLALLAPGLFFAARNVLRTGNPLYPLELRAFGRVWLPGESSLDGILTPAFNVPRELASYPDLVRPLWVWLQPHGPAQSYDARLAGFGYAFALVGLPALAWATWPRSGGSAPRLSLRPLRFVSGLTLGCWLIQPLSFWPRFTSWLWGAAALAIALLVTALSDAGRLRTALAIALLAALLAVPEALYALAHVKQLQRVGLGVLALDETTALARIAGLDEGFMARALLGKSDVCRTPWRLGTDDANLDGVVAQLVPRLRMHVVFERELGDVAKALRQHGCDELIAIGAPPLVHRAAAAGARVESALAFGPCHLITMRSRGGENP